MQTAVVAALQQTSLLRLSNWLKRSKRTRRTDEAAEANNVVPVAVLIHRQINQPNPAILMAMTDDGEKPSSTGPTPQLSG
jgi:hypothetical protein